MAKVILGILLGGLFACAIGIQNFPYSGTLYGDHLIAMLYSLFAFCLIGGIIGYMWSSE